jgi:hypothetical protein
MEGTENGSSVGSALNVPPDSVINVVKMALPSRLRLALLEHMPWDGELRHLEGDIAAVVRMISEKPISLSSRTTCSTVTSARSAPARMISAMRA